MKLVKDGILLIFHGTTAVSRTFFFFSVNCNQGFGREKDENRGECKGSILVIFC